MEETRFTATVLLELGDPSPENARAGLLLDLLEQVPGYLGAEAEESRASEDPSAPGDRVNMIGTRFELRAADELAAASFLISALRSSGYVNRIAGLAIDGDWLPDDFINGLGFTTAA